MTPGNRVRLSDLRNRYDAKCDEEDHVGEFTIEEMHELIGLFAERVGELEDAHGVAVEIAEQLCDEDDSTHTNCAICGEDNSKHAPGCLLTEYKKIRREQP